MAKFKIVLHKDGTQEVEPLDAVGQNCIALTEEYEKRSGIVIDRTLKPEYYETDVVLETEAVTVVQQ